jgi:pimeloyl-ACP methyl ester carboxylesterase
MASPGEASDFIKVYRERLSLTDRTVNCTLNRFEEIFGQAIEYFSVSKFAESLMLPGIIIHDQKDEEAPYEYARQINKAWKHSHLITTNGLGHNLKSQDVMKTVLDFVNGTVGKEFSMDEYRLIPTD